MARAIISVDSSSRKVILSVLGACDLSVWAVTTLSQTRDDNNSTYDQQCNVPNAYTIQCQLFIQYKAVCLIVIILAVLAGYNVFDVPVREECEPVTRSHSRQCLGAWLGRALARCRSEWHPRSVALALTLTPLVITRVGSWPHYYHQTSP